MLKNWIATQMDKCSFVKGQLALTVWMEIISHKASRVLWRNLKSREKKIVLADIPGIIKYEDEGISGWCNLAGFPKDETFSPKVLKEANWSFKNYKENNGKHKQRQSCVKIQDVTASYIGCTGLVASSQERHNNKKKYEGFTLRWLKSQKSFYKMGEDSSWKESR